VDGTPPPVPDTTGAASDAVWEPELGRAFIVVGATPDDATVVLSAFDESHPLDSGIVDIRQIRRQRFSLFGHGRALGTAALGADVNPDLPRECTSWPLVRLDQLSDSGARSWTVGFPVGAMNVYPVDSLAGMSPADSARLTREIARAASIAAGDTVAALRGIPYQVRRAYILAPSTTSQRVFAEVTRVLNQEASPIHEHLLLVATRDTTTGRLALTYSERDVGSEEAMESAELSFAGQIAGRSIDVLLVVRYVADGAVFSLLESTADGPWQVRWTSSYSGC
jgi:hypothetical protein